MAQAYFDCDFSYEMAVEADELAQREEKEAQERSQTYGIPSDQRVQLFSERPEVRSTQSGELTRGQGLEPLEKDEP